MTRDSAVYLDCAATTPVDERVAELVVKFMIDEYGNAGSRTHEFGSRAQKGVEKARAQVATVAGADPSEVIFTSGATEADNLALFGLAAYGKATGRTHIVSTGIEHKAVLQPLEVLEGQGFSVDLVPVAESGAVSCSDVLERIRSDTLLVSVMHVNNETGVQQPISEIAEGIANSEVFFHTDAAQGFGKVRADLRHPRIDLISISGHKIMGPKGVGALIARRRDRQRPPLAPLMHGGGQERGLRPGTLPVPLVCGLGLAAELADAEGLARAARAAEIKQLLLDGLSIAGAVPNGDPAVSVPFILNASFPGADSEALMLALRPFAAVSNGSACTSASYEPSHVLRAMGLDPARRSSAVRFSWTHATPAPDVAGMATAILRLL